MDAIYRFAGWFRRWGKRPFKETFQWIVVSKCPVEHGLFRKDLEDEQIFRWFVLFSQYRLGISQCRRGKCRFFSRHFGPYKKQTDCEMWVALRDSSLLSVVYSHVRKKEPLNSWNGTPAPQKKGDVPPSKMKFDDNFFQLQMPIPRALKVHPFFHRFHLTAKKSEGGNPWGVRGNFLRAMFKVFK